MGRFKDFLLEQVLFNYSISYVNAEGESKVMSVKASLRNDAMQKFRASDATKGYKEILAIRKGEVVTPAQEREDMNENSQKDSWIKTMGLSHSSHDIWNDKSGNKWKWDGNRFNRLIQLGSMSAEAIKDLDYHDFLNNIIRTYEEKDFKTIKHVAKALNREYEAALEDIKTKIKERDSKKK